MGDTWSEFESCVIVSGLTAVHKDELTAWAGAEDCDITFEAGTREDETFVVVHQEDTVKLLHTLEEQGYAFLRSEEEHGDESPWPACFRIKKTVGFVCDVVFWTARWF